MNCLAWNCRGLRNLRTRKELVEIIRAKDPAVVFIAETWTDEARLDRVQSSLELQNRWVVPSDNRGDTARRHEAWSELRRLNHHPTVPWICMGDFNELVSQEGKLGGAQRPNYQMQLFRDVIDECGFMDLGLQINHLRCDSSDHVPILLSLSGLGPPPRNKPFRFEEMWLSDSQCGDIVEATWRSMLDNDSDDAILTRVERCGRDLAWWDKNCFGNVRRELLKSRHLLVQAKKESIRSGCNDQVRELKVEISSLLDKEERMWNQRLRVLWMSQGDRNTKYFHSKATKRHRRNSIRGIRDTQNQWKEDPESIASVLINFYQELFLSSNPSLANGVLDRIPHLITIDMNLELSKEFLACEHHNSKKTSYMALKLDMSKAYDRMEWSFLEVIIRQMGFNEQWIGLVMVCVRTATYSILVNGEPKGLIHPSRGLRQGDPLPHSFSFYAPKDYMGLLGMRQMATPDECRSVMALLSLYEEASDLKVTIKGILGVQEVHQYEKYLGLPSLVGRGKRESFNYIKERVWKKLQGWEGKLLSQAGREVLVKSVIQAIPTYAMGCFKLPLGLCNDIEVLVKKFWWGQRGDRRKVHWLKWEEMTKSKMVGGMGGARWRIGSGRKVRVWQHHWLPRKHPPLLCSPVVEGFENATVDLLIDDENWTWNEELVDGLFAPEEADLIKSIPLARGSAEDILFWPHSSNGRYSCKTGYRFLKEENELSPVQEPVDTKLWKGIWALNCPNKINNFMWRACRNSVPSKVNLMQRTILQEAICERCNQVEESIVHAVWSCSSLDAVWSDLQSWGVRHTQSFVDFKELLSWILANHQEPELFATTLAQLAKDRHAEFLAVQIPRVPDVPHSRARSVPPSNGLLKINFDGASFRAVNKSGIGVVIRNGQGMVLASLSEKLPRAYSPEEVETLVAARAFVFAREIGVDNVVLEGDSSILMSALRREDHDLSVSGLLVEDVQLLAGSFSKLLYSHTRRDVNKLAHNLARFAVNISSFLVWMESVPSHFNDIYQADLAGFS
ncbi:uncharacterized protein LOC136070080 [Quercus suber]|uniref:uncharacterized protein LOC136070080 n=1 Tax=Quercus suber TaxID=58331 RepID=UPI0032DEC574